MMFQDLNLHPDLLKAIEELGYIEPTPIQKQAVPIIMNGLDLRASAQTGTGKTAAFLLPTLNRLTQPSPVKGFGPRALILAPTRELAMQIQAEANKLSKYLSRLRTVCIYGGAPYPVQNRDLARPYEILVATPGRLIDHMDRGRINFSRLEILILDEADRMLDMGFIEPVEKIAAATPKTRQTLMFSATLKGNVMNLSQRLLKTPAEISVTPQHAKHDNIEQRLHFVDNLNHKNRLLEHFLNDPSLVQAIVFTSTKNHADVLLDLLLDSGHKAAALHGDMNQRQRTRTIDRLRSGERNLKVLVATDVAARGIDVLTISHVINFDLPMSAEDYVHRIGRTGRAGGNGVALSFAAPKEMHLVKRIEQFTGQKITLHVVTGMEPQIKSMPSRGSENSHRTRQRRSGFKQGRGFKQGDGFRQEGGQGRGFKQGDGFRQEGGQGRGFKQGDSSRQEGGFREEGGFRKEGFKPRRSKSWAAAPAKRQQT